MRAKGGSGYRDLWRRDRWRYGKVAGRRRRRQGQRGWRAQGLRTRAVEQVRCTDWMARTARRRASRGGGIKVKSDQRLKPYASGSKARPLTLLLPTYSRCRAVYRGRVAHPHALHGGVKSNEKRDFFLLTHQTGTHETRSRRRRALYDLSEARDPSTEPRSVRYRARRGDGLCEPSATRVPSLH